MTPQRRHRQARSYSRRWACIYSRPPFRPVWRLLDCVVIMVFPVFVLLLLLVQFNALRYQDALIIWVQRAWLLIDETSTVVSRLFDARIDAFGYIELNRRRS